MPYSFSNFYTREEIIYWIISLILNLFLYCGSIKSYCTHIVTFRPEIPIPKLGLEIGEFVKDHECTYIVYSRGEKTSSMHTTHDKLNSIVKLRIKFSVMLDSISFFYFLLEDLLILSFNPNLSLDMSHFR